MLTTLRHRLRRSRRQIAVRRGRAVPTVPTFQGLEQLEPRMLMSAVVPAGFVELGTYSVDTRTDTP